MISRGVYRHKDFVFTFRTASLIWVFLSLNFLFWFLCTHTTISYFRLMRTRSFIRQITFRFFFSQSVVICKFDFVCLQKTVLLECLLQVLKKSCPCFVCSQYEYCTGKHTTSAAHDASSSDTNSPPTSQKKTNHRVYKYTITNNQKYKNI